MAWWRCDKSKRYLRCLRYIKILERTMREYETILTTNLMMTLTTHYERIDALLRRYDIMITSFVIWLFRLSFRGIDCISLLYFGMILYVTEVYIFKIYHSNKYSNLFGIVIWVPRENKYFTELTSKCLSLYDVTIISAMLIYYTLMFLFFARGTYEYYH